MNQEQYEALVQHHRENSDIFMFVCDYLEGLMKVMHGDVMLIKKYARQYAKNDGRKYAPSEMVRDGEMHLKMALANIRMYRSDLTRTMTEDEQMRFGDYADRIASSIEREYNAIKDEWIAANTEE